MNRKRTILLILAIIALSTCAAFGASDSYRKPDLTNVTGIRFEPAAPVELKELVDGHFYDFEEFDGAHLDYYYNCYEALWRDGSALILIHKDGSETPLVYDDKKKGFIGKDRYKINRSAVECRASEENECEDVWSIGNIKISAWSRGEHSVTIGYGGLTCKVPVTVVDNGIEKIKFVPHSPLIKNYGGYWSKDKAGNRYYHYCYVYGDKDKVILTMKDGSVKTYIHENDDYVEDDSITYYYFRCKDGTSIALHYFQLIDDQATHHWTKGGDNYMIFYFAGLRSRTPVKVADSPIDSISYKPIVPIVYRENIGMEQRYDPDKGSSYYVYSDPRPREGDKLTVVKKGKKKVYTYAGPGKSCFVCGKDRIYYWVNLDIETFQRDKPWILGTDNTVEFNYLGRSCKVKVRIQKEKIENPMQASGKTIRIKQSKLKKKTLKFAQNKAFQIINAEGAPNRDGSLIFRMTKKDKRAKNKIAVSGKGIVTIRKGLKKGKYTTLVKVTSAGNESYKPKTQEVKVCVIVK